MRYWNSSYAKYAALLFLGVFLSTTACEEIDLDSEEAGEVQGFWQLRSGTGDNTFLLVSATEVIFYFYDRSENCITLDTYEVVSIDGTGFYLLRQEDTEETRGITFSRNGDGLHVRDIDESQSNLDKYQISAVDINTLAPVCVDPTDVFGLWEYVNEMVNDTVYVSIQMDTIKVASKGQQEDCFFTSVLEVLAIDGTKFTIQDNDPSSETGQQEVTLTRTNDGLRIQRMEEGVLVDELYTQSDFDFSTAEPECSQTPIDLFQGIWQYNAPVADSFTFYLSITQESMNYHFPLEGTVDNQGQECYQVEVLPIIEAGEGFLTVTLPPEQTEQVKFFFEFNSDEGLLYIDDGFQKESFFPSDITRAEITNSCVLLKTN